MHYSWWLFHKINQKSLNKDIGHKVRTISRFMDTMLKNKVVHLSISMSKHLKSHQSSFNRQIVIFIAKGSSSSYNNFPVLLGKKSLSLSTFPTFIQKEKNGWASQSDLWASQPLVFPTLHFSQKSFTKY